MAESRRVCTRAQQSMRSSNRFARTSRFSALVAELLISRHAPCKKKSFFGTNVPFSTDSKKEFISIPAKRLGFLEHPFSTRKERSAGDCFFFGRLLSRSQNLPEINVSFAL